MLLNVRLTITRRLYYVVCLYMMGLLCVQPLLSVNLTVDCDVLATHLVLSTIEFWGVESPVYDCTFWTLLSVARATTQKNESR